MARPDRTVLVTGMGDDHERLETGARPHAAGLSLSDAPELGARGPATVAGPSAAVAATVSTDFPDRAAVAASPARAVAPAAADGAAVAIPEAVPGRAA